jgi:hypothetical protein
VSSSFLQDQYNVVFASLCPTAADSKEEETDRIPRMIEEARATLVSVAASLLEAKEKSHYTRACNHCVNEFTGMMEAIVTMQHHFSQVLPQVEQQIRKLTPTSFIEQQLVVRMLERLAINEEYMNTVQFIEKLLDPSADEKFERRQAAFLVLHACKKAVQFVWSCMLPALGEMFSEDMHGFSVTAAEWLSVEFIKPIVGAISLEGQHFESVIIHGRGLSKEVLDKLQEDLGKHMEALGIPRKLQESYGMHTLFGNTERIGMLLTRQVTTAVVISTPVLVSKTILGGTARQVDHFLSNFPCDKYIIIFYVPPFSFVAQ